MYLFTKIHIQSRKLHSFKQYKLISRKLYSCNETIFIQGIIFTQGKHINSSKLYSFKEIYSFMEMIFIQGNMMRDNWATSLMKILHKLSTNSVWLFSEVYHRTVVARMEFCWYQPLLGAAISLLLCFLWQICVVTTITSHQKSNNLF